MICNVTYIGGVMVKKTELILMFVLFVLLVFIAISSNITDSSRLVNIEVEGKVFEIQWTTTNHNLPLFKIKQGNKIVEIQHHRVLLTSKQIKVGDSFKKIAGSKTCFINAEEIPCIR